MNGTALITVELLAECDARGILLRPVPDGGLNINAPQDGLPCELLDRLKANKARLCALLMQSVDLDANNVPEVKRVETRVESAYWACRCGSKKWKEVPIHDGRSIRQDCDRCGRFIRFSVWYGKDTVHYAQ